jgi:uncharacterized protein YkwD
VSRPAVVIAVAAFVAILAPAIHPHITASDAVDPVALTGNTWDYVPSTDVLSPPSPPVLPAPAVTSSGIAAESGSGRDAGTPRLNRRRDRVINLTNAQRTASGLADLQTSVELTDSAQRYADHLAVDGNFSHTDGSVLASRVSATGYRYQFLGENLALGQRSAHSVVAAWMASPDHRANMLDPRFTQMGVGIATRSDGQIVWCIDFGWPSPPPTS